MLLELLLLLEELSELAILVILWSRSRETHCAMAASSIARD
jgi:hypothetical protein